MSQHYLGKHEPQKLCLFSHTMSQKQHGFDYSIAVTTIKQF